MEAVLEKWLLWQIAAFGEALQLVGLCRSRVRSALVDPGVNDGRTVSTQLIARAVYPFRQYAQRLPAPRIRRTGHRPFDCHGSAHERGDFDSTQGMMLECTDRFDDALNRNQIIPVDTDDIEDALTMRNGKHTDRARLFQTTTLLPLLGTVVALMGNQEVPDQLTTEVFPNLKGVTMERWYPQATLQTLTALDSYVNNVGVSRAIAGFRGSTAEETEASVSVQPHSAQPEDSPGTVGLGRC